MAAEDYAAHRARVAAATLEGRLRGAGRVARSGSQLYELALLHEPEWSSQRLQHLVRFQARVRGALARAFARDVVAPRLYVSQAAVRSLTAELRETHEGWIHCIGNILLVFFIAALSLTQTSLAGSGGAYEQSLVAMFEELEWGDGLVLADVRKVSDVTQYGAALVKALYRADPYTPPRCVLDSGAEVDHCAGPLYNASWWDRCGVATEFSGFVDSFSRTQVGLVVKQSRFEAQPCERQAVRSAEPQPPVQDSSIKSSLACTGGGTARAFSSVFGSLHPDAMRAVPPNIGVGPFSYSSSLDGFLVVLDLGGANLDASASLCRWDYLRSVEWLDRATSKVEFTVTLLNQNGPGKLVTITVEFALAMSGQLTSSVWADSVTLSSGSSQRFVLLLTALYAALALLGGVWLLGRTVSELGCCTSYRFFKASRKWGRLRWFIELTVCVMNFVCISLYINFAFSANRSSEIDVRSALVLSDDAVVVLGGLRSWGSALRICYGTLLFLLWCVDDDCPLAACSPDRFPRLRSLAVCARLIASHFTKIWASSARRVSRR
jgi:hypothetical protein